MTSIMLEMYMYVLQRTEAGICRFISITNNQLNSFNSDILQFYEEVIFFGKSVIV